MGEVAAPGFQSPGHVRQIAGWNAFCRLSIAVGTTRSLATRVLQSNQFLIAGSAILFLLWMVPPLHGREHKRKVASEIYGLVFSTEITSPESEVLKAVEAIVNNGIIQGSKEFNKDKYIENAGAAASSPMFPEWKEPGKVYYKVRTGVLAPLNFKDSKDEGTLAVRYVVQSKDESKTICELMRSSSKTSIAPCIPPTGAWKAPSARRSRIRSTQPRRRRNKPRSAKNNARKNWRDRRWNANVWRTKPLPLPPRKRRLKP